MNVVILAAGMGRRMHSDLPKVLHPLAGKPLLSHVLDVARSLAPSRIVVVYGHGGETVPAALAAPDVEWALQDPQLGTGHAVMQALPHLEDAAPTLILYGDVPLITSETLRRLLAAGNDHLALLTAVLDDPTGYGRIVREHTPNPDRAGRILRIVEEKDAAGEASRAIREIREINTGVLVAPTPALRRWLGALSNDNAQREYYLTDVVAMAVGEGMTVGSAQPGAAWETLGVNSRSQLAELERIHQRNIAEALMAGGVTLADPSRIDVRGTLRCGRDVSIDVNCVFEGNVVLGDRVRIGAGCVIRDCELDADVQLLALCHIEEARIGSRSRVGPYSRIRPGTVLGDDNHVGNFVELKNTRMAAGSKANHLAYVGDTEVGARVNIGAGTITCNYDGANKHVTVIEDDAFIGSDCQLIAPVRVGRGATLGAGTTLARDAPPDQLTVSRGKQVSIAGWKRPVKQRT
jgi:bifunctional UDP-N-acetylglucosamine pyrophosphorylase / glucosamine-1-phosphate N-acetyltransferase